MSTNSSNDAPVSGTPLSETRSQEAMSGTLNRRQLLRTAALGAVVGAVPARSALAEADPDAGPWWLLNPYRPGVEVGLGWQVGGLTEPHRGAYLLQLHHVDGGSARVNVCFHQGQPKGIGHTEHLDLILMDGGDGDQPTRESLGRVIRQIAVVMRENEAKALHSDGPEAAQLAALLTHSERVERFGPEALL